MNASCGVQKNIHKCLIALFNDVSRKLGTYHRRGVCTIKEGMKRSS